MLLDLRQLLASQIVLGAIALGLDRPGAQGVGQFIIDLIFQFDRFGATGRQGASALRRAVQTLDIVVDVRQGLFVGEAGLLQRRLVGLQLGYRLDQARLTFQHVEGQIGIAQCDQRLPLADLVARLDQDLVDAPTFQRRQQYRVVGDDLAA